MVNKVTLIGHLGKDPEVRHLESGSTVARMSIATNERYRDKSGQMQTLTEWHDVVMWRGLAETAEKILTKGRLIYIEGRLTYRSYQDKDGIDRYITEVVANNFQLLDKRPDGQMPQNNMEQTASAAPPTAASTTENSPLADDDDLPF